MSTYKINRVGWFPNDTPSSIKSANTCAIEYYHKYYKTGGCAPTKSYFILGGWIHNIVEGVINGTVDINQLEEEYEKAVIATFGDRLYDLGSQYTSEFESAVERVNAEAVEKYGKAYKQPQNSASFQRQFGSKFKEVEEQAGKLIDPTRFDMATPFLEMFSSGNLALKNFKQVFTSSLSKYQKLIPEVPLKPTLVGTAYRSGTIDLIGKNKDTTIDILDFKTGYGKWTKEMVKNSLQLLWYADCYEKIFLNTKVRDIGIIDLRRGEIVRYHLEDDSLEHFSKVVAPDLAHKLRIDDVITTELRKYNGYDLAWGKVQPIPEAVEQEFLLTLPNAVSSAKAYCPCSVVAKCPAFRVYEVRKKEPIDSDN